MPLGARWPWVWWHQDSCLLSIFRRVSVVLDPRASDASIEAQGHASVRRLQQQYGRLAHFCSFPGGGALRPGSPTAAAT
jgi:hypothetical protein